MKIQAFRNMNHSYDHWTKQKNRTCQLGTSEWKVIHDQSFVSIFFNNYIMEYFWQKKIKVEPLVLKTLGHENLYIVVNFDNSNGSWFSTCTKLNKLFEVLKFQYRTSILFSRFYNFWKKIRFLISTRKYGSLFRRFLTLKVKRLSM